MPHIPTEERRRQIIKAAVGVISREGAARTTTRAVAKAADAPLASLHYAFLNKDELFTAVIDHILDYVDEQHRRHVDPGGGLTAAVRALFELNFDWCRSEPEFHIAEYELFVWALRTTSARGLGRRIYQRWFDVVSGILAESIGERENPPPFIHTLARDVVSGLDGMLLQIIALGDDGPSREDLTRYIEAALISLRTHDGAAEG
jgi:AcrR family transcriptional regulator